MWRPLDTSPDAYRRQLAAYRSMTGADRLRLAAGMSDAVRRLAAEGRRTRRPDGAPDGLEAKREPVTRK